MNQMAPIESSDPRKTVTTRVEESTLDQFDQIADREGKSRAEKLREMIRDEVADHDDRDQHDDLPASDRLREAYLTLVEQAEEHIEGAGLRISREEAVNLLYTNRTPKNAVMRSLIRPLKQTGYVKVDPAMNQVWVVVRPVSDGATGDFDEPRTDSNGKG